MGKLTSEFSLNYKLEGLALLVANPSRCNSTNEQNSTHSDKFRELLNQWCDFGILQHWECATQSILRLITWSLSVWAWQGRVRKRMTQWIMAVFVEQPGSAKYINPNLFLLYHIDNLLAVVVYCSAMQINVGNKDKCSGLDMTITIAQESYTEPQNVLI